MMSVYRHIVVMSACLSLAACGRSKEASLETATVERPWQVDAGGIGAVRVGMTVAEAEQQAGITLTGERDGECAYLQASRAVEGLLFMARSGRIARVDVTTMGVPTDGDVRVGDAEARVRAVYGDALTEQPHKYVEGGHYLTVAPDASHRLVFETDGEKVIRYHAGRTPEVEWVEGCS